MLEVAGVGAGDLEAVEEDGAALEKSPCNSLFSDLLWCPSRPRDLPLSRGPFHSIKQSFFARSARSLFGR